MSMTSFRINQAAKKKSVLIGLSLLLLAFVFETMAEQPANAEANLALDSNEEFSKQYTEITRKLILAGVELERFSLKYRKASTEQPKFRRLRFFLAQEAGAAGAMAFEATGLKQFGTGRRHPLQVNKSALHASLVAGLTGSVIAGSGAGLELASNAALAYKNKRRGFDPRAANRFVCEKVKEIDRLLAERDAIVAAHADSPAHDRAIAEGRLARQIRNASLAEYAAFHSDVKGYATFTNTFFALNALTNSLASTGLGIAYQSINTPKYTGPANIFFIVTGAIIIAVPMVSSGAGTFMRWHAYHSLCKRLGEEPRFDFAEFSAARARVQELESTKQGVLIPTLPMVERAALYAESQDRFQKQIIDETNVARHLEKVALQSNLLGPAIGSTLMTQGILGTYGYYKFTFRPRPQLAYAFRGAVVGTTGAGGLALGGNAAWFLASYAYEHHLRSEHRLPSQVIDERLSHLDDLEKIARAM
jgi:hypothetical protein